MNLAEVKVKYPGCTTFTFRDNVKLCDELVSLVRNEKKTATCQALREFESGMETMPSVGRIDIALNWDGTPARAIRTLSIVVEKYSEVGELLEMTCNK